MSATTQPAIAPIGVRTTGVHHVAIRCTDIARARLFYIERLGFPVLIDTPDLFIFAAGQTAFGVRGPAPTTPADDTFDPFRVGLDHIALGCDDAAELRRVADALASAGIESTGVKVDPTLGKEYVAFKDPDGVKWELYMA
jgi:catechol 2,3-dioxygenase-like lactoylglutathione lyase family enzyme